MDENENNKKKIPVMFSCLLASIFVLYTAIMLGLVPVVQVCLCLLLMLRGQSVYRNEVITL